MKKNTRRHRSSALPRKAAAFDVETDLLAAKPSRAVRNRSDPPACVLTIAGSDSSGGAGVQADARAIHSLGGYAATAITALTAQNTRGVWAVEPMSPKMLARQIEAVLADLPIHAIKIGLLPNANAVEVISQVLMDLEGAIGHVVIDPVLASTSGTRFLTKAGIRLMKKQLFPGAALITPNWPEAIELSGVPIASPSDAEKAARKMIERTGCLAVLVKGGHAPGRKFVDVLVKADGAPAIRFEHPRIKSSNTHGTGCVLSAAIATRLAQGWTVENAVGNAVDFLQAALAKSAPALWNGRGPCLL